MRLPPEGKKPAVQARSRVTQLAQARGLMLPDFVHGCLLRHEEVGRSRVRRELKLTSRELDLVLAVAQLCKPVRVNGEWP